MKDVIWAIHEIRFRLARWRANRHIARTDALIKIMQDACEQQTRIMEAEE